MLNTKHHDAVLITLADENFIEQAKQLFSSVYHNAGWSEDYMLLAHNIPEMKLKWFRERGILIKHCTDFCEPRGTRRMVLFSKLNVFSEELKRWKNIIYLDADIIVRGSLQELAIVQGFHAAKTLDFKRTERLKFQFMNYNKTYLKKLKQKFDLNTSVFNAGVLAFSTDIINKNLINKFKEIFEEYRGFMCLNDETILNIYYYRTWNKLPAIYNICPNYEMGYRRCKTSELVGRVLHCYSTFFPASKKIWSPGSPLYGEWKSNLEKAESTDFSLPPATIKQNPQDIQKDSDMLLRLNKKKYLPRYYFAHLYSLIFNVARTILGQKLETHFPLIYRSYRKNFLEKIQKSINRD